MPEPVKVGVNNQSGGQLKGVDPYYKASGSSVVGSSANFSSGSTPYSKVSGANVVQSALAGASGGVPGMLFSLIGNMILQGVQNRAARKNQQIQNSFNAEQAELANSRALGMMDKEKSMNSAQRLVSDLKMAGLNPALATGTISPGNVTPASSPAASGAAPAAAPYTPIDLNAAMMSAAEIENLQSSSALNRSNTASIDINNKYIDSLRQSDIAKQLQEIVKLKTSAALDESQKKQIDELLDSLRRQYESTIALNEANASAVPQQIEESKSRAALNEQHVAESKSVVGLNRQKTAESKSQEILNQEQALTEIEKRSNLAAETGLAEAKTLTETEQQSVLRSTKALNDVNKDVVQQQFDITSSQRRMIEKYCHEHDLDAGWVNAIMIAFNEFASETGRDVPKATIQILESWLDGGNWLHFVASSRFNDVLAHNAESNQKTSENVAAPVERRDPTDVAKTFPSQKSFNYHEQQLSPKLPQEFKDEYVAGLKWINHLHYKGKIPTDIYKKFITDLYYTDDPDEYMSKFYEYYYEFKYKYND